MRTIRLHPIVCVLLFLVITVSHVRAQDDDYEEYFVEDPYGEQLERTLDTPLNLDSNVYSENGTPTMAYLSLTMLEASDDLTQVTNEPEQNESSESRTFQISWGNLMLSSFLALAGAQQLIMPIFVRKLNVIRTLLFRKRNMKTASTLLKTGR